jgi:hypothetical protein
LPQTVHEDVVQIIEKYLEEKEAIFQVKNAHALFPKNRWVINSYQRGI